MFRTDQNGAVSNRKDYTAFGEVNYTANRVAGLGYDTTDEETRKGYTGYEKDDESGLDYAQARYYNSTHGRYTSIDPLTASASIRNPQTFNRYSYVLNSPYKYTDPLGLLPEAVSFEDGYCPASASSCEEVGKGGRRGPVPAVDEEVAPNQEPEEGIVDDHTPDSTASEQQSTQADPPPPPVASDAEIEITSIQIVTEVPKLDDQGNEVFDNSTILANGQPVAPFGPELNIAGAAEMLRQGKGVWVRITLSVTNDERASFTPADVRQTGTSPVLVGSGQEDTLVNSPSTKPITRLSEDGRTATTYVFLESKVRNLSDLPKSVAVKSTVFYRDAFSNGRAPGEFSINQPKKITKSFRIRLFNEPPKAIW